MGLWFTIKSDTHRLTRVHTSTSSALNQQERWRERDGFVCASMCLYI